MSSGRPREVSFPNRIRVRLSRRDRDLILKHTFIGGDRFLEQEQVAASLQPSSWQYSVRSPADML